LNILAEVTSNAQICTAKQKLLFIPKMDRQQNCKIKKYYRS